MNDYFYGWYYRCQGREGTVAVIPAVHLSSGKGSCSVQVITPKESLYREFPLSQFRINRTKGIIQIGDNLFSRKGIRLRLEAFRSEDVSRGPGTSARRGRTDRNKVSVRGTLRFGEFAVPKYDIMGPLSVFREWSADMPFTV